MRLIGAADEERDAPFLLAPWVMLSGVGLAGSLAGTAPCPALLVSLVWGLWAIWLGASRLRVLLGLSAAFLFFLCAARADRKTSDFMRLSESVRTEIGGPERCIARVQILSSPVQRSGRGFRGEKEVRESWVGEARALDCGNLATDGPLVIRVASEPMGLGRGDVVEGVFQLAPLELFRNAGVSDAPGPAARQGIVLSGSLIALDERREGSSLRRTIDRARAFVRARIERTFDPGIVSLAKALVLGESDLDDAERAAFAESGLMHVLAVSGTHLVVSILSITSLLRMILVRVPRLARRFDVARASSALGTGLAWIYEDFSGGSGSAFRAACMLSAVLGARALGYRLRGGSALGLSILWGLAVDPLLGGDLSFLLSALSTLGLLSLGQPLTRRLIRGPFLRQPLRFVSENLIATISASLGCAPAIAFMNDELTLAALLANLIAAPVGEMFALPACLLHAISSPWSALERGLAWAGSLALGIVREVALMSAGVESLKFRVGLPGEWDVAFFVVLALALLGVFARVQVGRARFVLGSLAALVCFARYWPPAEAWADARGKLSVTVLDVGQGDAIWIDFPDGRVGLVDGGGYPGGKPDTGARVLLPWIRARGARTIDVVILSHPDRDHMLGLGAVLEAVPVRELWHGDRPGEDSKELRRLLEVARRRNIRVRSASELCGQVSDFGARVRVLAPCGEALALGRNDASMVVRVEYGSQSALLTGDIELPGEASLLENAKIPLEATLLKVAHHGSDTSSSPALLARVQPKVAFVSVGIRNSFGHPKAEVLERFEARGTELFRTDRNGSLSFETDGREATVRVAAR